MNGEETQTKIDNLNIDIALLARRKIFEIKCHEWNGLSLLRLKRYKRDSESLKRNKKNLDEMKNEYPEYFI